MMQPSISRVAKFFRSALISRARIMAVIALPNVHILSNELLSAPRDHHAGRQYGTLLSRSDWLMSGVGSFGAAVVLREAICAPRLRAALAATHERFPWMAGRLVRGKVGPNIGVTSMCTSESVPILSSPCGRGLHPRRTTALTFSAATRGRGLCLPAVA